MEKGRQGYIPISFIILIVRTAQLSGSLFPGPGSRQSSLQWRQGVLTTGPPGKSQIMSFFVFLPLTTSSRLHCATDALSVSLLRCELSAELHLRLSFH